MLATCGLFMVVESAFTQTWTPSGAPETSHWQSIATSADGSKLVAASGDSVIYTSTNSGVTWTSNNVPIQFATWNSVASSADGTRLVAVGGGAGATGAIFTSTNGGAIWTSNSAPNETWTSVASSADGNKLVAVAGVDAYGAVGSISATCISTNEGATWTQTSAPTNYWVSVASSADGTKLVAASMMDTADENPGLVYLSTNSGGTWTQSSAPSNAWSCVASSADGSKLAATCFPGALVNRDLTSAGSIYTSTDSGLTWTSNNVPDQGWQAIASSADGRLLVAGVNGGQIYSSTNSGATWTTNIAPNGVWNSFASSADGSKLVGVALNFYGIDGLSDGIYTSQTTPAPQLNLASSGSNLTASWVVPSTNFVLQQSFDLAGWTDVTNPPVLNLTNLQDEAMLSPTNSSGFYRLKTP